MVVKNLLLISFGTALKCHKILKLAIPPQQTRNIYYLIIHQI